MKHPRSPHAHVPDLDAPSPSASGEYRRAAWGMRDASATMKAISVPVPAPADADVAMHGRVLDDDLFGDEEETRELEIRLASSAPSSLRAREKPPRSRAALVVVAPHDDRAALVPAAEAPAGMLPPAPPWPVAPTSLPRAATPRFDRRAPAAAAIERARPEPAAVVRAVDPASAVLAFAGYGAPPAGLLGEPGYAVKVLVRQVALRRDLESARRRASPDVDLYMAALRCADRAAVARGVLLILAFFLAVPLFVYVLAAVLRELG